MATLLWVSFGTERVCCLTAPWKKAITWINGDLLSNESIETHFSDIWLKIHNFLSRKYIWICCLPDAVHFVQLLVRSCFDSLGPCWVPFHHHGLTLITACLKNHTPSKVWDEITYQLLQLNDFTVEICKWMSFHSRFYNGCNHFIHDGTGVNCISKRDPCCPFRHDLRWYEHRPGWWSPVIWDPPHWMAGSPELLFHGKWSLYS